eukprot:769413_1
MIPPNLSNTFLSFGYCRKSEKHLATHIPDAIKRLISDFIIKHEIIAIGQNSRGQLQCGDDDTPRELSKWTHLTHLEDFANHITNIHVNHNALILVDAFNKLYVSGCNKSNRLGITNHTSSDIWIVYTANDNLFASGIHGNQNGQFGNGQMAPHEGVDGGVFIQIPRFWTPNERISKIHCAQMRSMFLTDKGNVYAAGHNVHNVCSPFHNNEHILVPELIYTNIRQIALGVRYNILLDYNDRLTIFGGTGLGDPTNAKIVTTFFKKKKK